MRAMELPEYVMQCIEALEQAGYAAYAVGGCVRDGCLGLTPKDYDLCTQALPEQTQAVFADFRLILTGIKHGTVGVITDGGVVEITTFRTEGSYQDNRHPDWVRFVPNIREDLARRDYTVNAMAYSPSRGFVDPFGGMQDLRAHCLRAVGDPVVRFTEDSLRILRGARFSLRYGLEVEPLTMAAMDCEAYRMETLARERVFEELCKLIPLMEARDLQRFSMVLAAAIPELKPMIGFDQHSPHHAYDLYTHTAHVTAKVPRDLTLRWAALLHDVGKVPSFTQDENGRGHFYGHAGIGAEIADGILLRLKAPTALRQQAVTLIAQHMNRLEPDKKLLRRRLGKLGWDTVDKLLLLQRADMDSKGVNEGRGKIYFDQVELLLEELRQEDACLSLKDLAVKGNDLLAVGIRGRQVGQALNWMLEQVLEEALPNEKGILMKSYMENHNL